MEELWKVVCDFENCNSVKETLQKNGVLSFHSQYTKKKEEQVLVKMMRGISLIGYQMKVISILLKYSGQ